MREGWMFKKLGEVITLYDSQRKPVTKKDRKGGVYPYYGASGIQDYVDRYIFDGRFLLVGEDGAKWGANERTTFIAEGKIWVNNHAHIMTFDTSVNDRFVEYYLNGKDLNEYITGAVVPKLTQASLISIPIPVPPLSEQQRIVSELDLLSSIIEKKKAQLKEYDALAQSTFYDMFGDPVTNEKGWEVKKLGEVCLLKAGKAIKSSELKDKADNLYPCYGGNGIRGYIEKISHRDDLPIIGRQGALCGNVNFAKAPFYATEHAVVVSPLIEMNKKWLFYGLRFLHLEQYAHGVAQPGIAVNDLKPISFALPPLSLQQSFASKIEAIENQKALIQQSITEAETLFNSRMDYWFS